MTNIAVISDLHGNADSLSSCLEHISSQNIDILICLGDILTYGTQPNEVIDQLNQYQKKAKLIMIRGNHEEFYFSSEISATYKIPSFVKESIDWTKKNLKFTNLEQIFNWKKHYLFENIYFAHANPFKYGDWSYIETEKKITEAIKQLEKQKFLCGVFGHSHRQYILQGPSLFNNSFCSNLEDLKTPVIVNVGSVGQPRGRGFCYSLLQIDDHKIEIELINFKPDLKAMINDINLTSLSKKTKLQLIEYLKK